MPNTHTFTELEFASADGDSFDLGFGLAVELLSVTAMCRGEQNLSLTDVWVLPGPTIGGLTSRLLPEGRVELYDGGAGLRPRVRAAAVLDLAGAPPRPSARASATRMRLSPTHAVEEDVDYCLHPEYLDRCLEEIGLSADPAFNEPTRICAERVSLVSLGRTPSAAIGSDDGEHGCTFALYQADALVALAERVVIETGFASEYAHVLEDAWRAVGVGDLPDWDQDLWELGLSSLDLTRLVGVLEEATGRRLSVREFSARPTLRLFAERLAAAPEEAGWPPLKPAADQQRWPITPAQKALWLRAQAAPDDNGFNFVLRFRVVGANVPEVVFEAVGRLLAAYPMFAGAFVVEGERVFQTCPGQALASDVLVRLSESERDTLERREREPFDLEAGPLLRATLLDDGAGHDLSLAFAHIAIDERSLPAVLSALSGYDAGTSPRWSFADVGHWYDTDAVRARIEEASQRALSERAGLQPMRLLLAADAPDPTGPGERAARGAHVEVAFTAAEVTALEVAARGHGVGLHALLLAAWAFVIERFCEGEPIVQLTAAGRPTAATDRIVGLFAVGVPCRLPVPGDALAGDWLRAVSQRVAEAIDLQHAPWQAGLACGTSEPLTQVGLVYLDTAVPFLQLGDARVEWSQPRLDSAPPDAARLELELVVARAGELMRAQLVYRLDRVTPATAEALSTVWKEMVLAIPHYPDHKLVELRALLEDEHPRMQACPRGEPMALGPADGLVPTLIRRVHEHPDRAAVQTETSALSYAELWTRAVRFAGRIAATVPPETNVAIDAERSENLLVAMLAVLLAGCRFVALDRSAPSARLREQVRLGRVRAWLSDQPLDDVSADAGTPLTWLSPSEVGQGEPLDAPRTGEGAYVMFTSGSTGAPKPILLSRSGLDHLLHAMATVVGSEPPRWLCLTTPTFDISVLETLFPLLHGGTVVLGPELRADTPGSVFERLHALSVRCDVTHFQSTPSLLQVLLARGAAAWLGRLRLLLVGGEAFAPELAATLKALGIPRVINGYGPTEATIYATTWEVKQGARRVPIGRPLPNTRLRVCDAEGQPVPLGVQGELWIGGPCVAIGYLHDDPADHARFVTLDGDGGRWYRTGDLVRLREDGDIEWLARCDRQIKVAGRRIEPAEIEAVLQRHPRVERAAVVVREARGVQELCAYLQPRALASMPAPARVSANRGGRSDARRDSALGTPIPEVELSQWACAIGSRLGLTGRERLLELGCDEPRLTARLLNRVRDYVGVDRDAGLIADATERGIQAARARFELTDALDYLQTTDERFDRILMHSAVSRCESLSQLIALLRAAERCLTPGGFVLLADVRHLGLQYPQALSNALVAAADDQTLSDVTRRAQAAVCAEGDLLLRPELFWALSGPASVRLKEGAFWNELVRYRFDATLGREGALERGEIEVVTWGEGDAALFELGVGLRKHGAVLLANIPNARLSADRALFELAERAAPELKVRALRRTLACQRIDGVDPESLRARLSADGIRAELLPARSGDPFCFDLWVGKGSDRALSAGPPASGLTHLRVPESGTPLSNHPERTRAAIALVSEARALCKDALPPFLVPTHMGVIDRIPLTRSGKLDSQALLAQPPLLTGAPAGRPPDSELERLHARHWGLSLDLAQVPVDVDFFELGGSSLTAFRLVEALRAEGQAVTVGMLFAHRTIERVLDALSQTAPCELPRPSLPRRLTLAGPRPDRDPWPPGARVLLTGATGYVGAYLLLELLADPSQTVVCLIRAASCDDARARLEDNLRGHGLLQNADLTRVEVVCGDLAQPDLGLCHEQLDRLAERVDVIVHSAASVHFLASIESLWAANVAGTAALLRLAASGRARPFHFISSVAAAGGATHPVSEVDALTEPPQDGYGQSKRAAEQLVLAMRERGLPAVVYRLGVVASDSRYRDAAFDDALFRWLAGVVRLGAVFEADPRTALRHVVPADWAARALAALMRARTDMPVLHLAPPGQLDAATFAEWARAAGYKVRCEPYAAWLSRLRADAAVNPIAPLLGLFQVGEGVRPIPPMQSQRTAAALSACGLEFPMLDAETLAGWLDLLCRTGRLSR